MPGGNHESRGGGLKAALTRWSMGAASLLLTAIAGIGLVIADDIPTEDEIRADIRDFQGYFLSRFPGVSRESFGNGVAALPQYSNQMENLRLLSQAPPYLDALEAGEQAWQAPMMSGLTLADCFSGKPPPIAYPYYFSGSLRTVVGDINQCRSENGEPPLAPESAEMAALIAAWKAPWRGQPLDVDYRDAEVRRLYGVGRQYFWAKRGQMNLSCANCHVHNAGNRLRGQVLSAALGHGMGYPAYSFNWKRSGEPMGTLHRRYARCHAFAGAAPLEPESETQIALALYQAIMNSGLPLGAPSLRP